MSKKRSIFYRAEDAINASICYADQLMVDMRMTTKQGNQTQAELRAILRLLRKLERARVKNGHWGPMLWDEDNIAISKLILSARRVSARRKP